MNIIIPMAGQGSRFTQSGFRLPKPLIEVADKPMYQHAVDCLPLDQASRLVFILRKSDFSDLLREHIYQHYATSQMTCEGCSVLILDQDTQGQAETVLKSANILDTTKPSLIHNCDTEVSTPWPDFLNLSDEGAAVLFSSQEERWSYAKLNDEHNRIIEFREKQVISPYASSGTYFFKDTSLMLCHIEQLIAEDIRENNEFYLSSVYSLMIRQGRNILPLFSDTLLCFGTPQDLVDSLNKKIESLYSTSKKGECNED